MDSSSFNILVQEVKRQRMASDKVATIRSSIGGCNAISAEQVATLIELISFDNEQLEVATMAYSHATNKPVYAIIVGKALKLSSSRDKLKRFIAEA